MKSGCNPSRFRFRSFHFGGRCRTSPQGWHKIRIVSAPSEGLFRSQSKEYQNSIIPTGAKVFGLTAGLPVNLEGLVGANGKVFGLESFGFSAPYKVLDEKLGFTAQNVYNQVKEMLA